MIGVQNEQDVQNPHRLGVDLIRHHRRVEHHVEEVRAVGEIVPGVDHRFPDRLLVGERRHRAHDRNQPCARAVDVVGHRLEVDVGVKDRQRIDHGRQNVHRVRALRKMIEEMAHILVQQRIDVEQRRELQPLLLGRQFAVDQQIGDLDEGGLLDQLLNRNAAITQNSPLPVHKGDLAVAGGGIHEARVEGHITGFTAEPGDVDRLFPLRADHHRQPHRLPFHLKCHKFGTLVHFGILLLPADCRYILS